MKILRSELPYILELEYEEARALHLVLYTSKPMLKNNKKIPSKDKKSLMKIINNLIATVDLMI